jgi:hypothetical protein
MLDRHLNLATDPGVARIASEIVVLTAPSMVRVEPAAKQEYNNASGTSDLKVQV